MRILLVEDDVEKAAQVIAVLTAIPGISSEHITHCDCKVEAKRSLLNESFDLLILDIQLPTHAGERPKLDGGATLLSEIRFSRRYSVPLHVVGLTQYSNSDQKIEEAFAENASVIIQYSRASDTWSNRLTNRIEQILITQAPQAPQAPQAIEHIVVLIHGIRTHSTWAEMVAETIEKAPGIHAIPIRYGYFDTFRFWCPFFTRRAPINRIIREFRDIRTSYQHQKISVIAHSYGTYCVSLALKEPEIRLHRIILCGSIIPQSFRVANFKGQLGPDPILNDCGSNDVWPVLAQATTWGYGFSGTFGFGTTGIRDRFNRFRHGDYFDHRFVKKYWLPFLKNGKIVRTHFESVRPTPSFFISLLSWLPLKSIVICAAIIAAYFFMNLSQN